MKKRVIIFGASKRIKEKCKNVLNFRNLEIVAYIDNNRLLWEESKKEEVKVISVQKLKEMQLLYDIILIATVYYAPLLYEQLINEGFEKDKIFLLCSPEDCNEIFFDTSNLIDTNINKWVYKDNINIEQLIIKNSIFNFKLNTYKKIYDNRERWYHKNSFIAHGGGGYVHKKRFPYSNSIEAFEESYQRGFRAIETDLMLTSDNQLVLSHNWYYCDLKDDIIPDLKYIKNSLLKKNISIMRFEDLLHLMETKNFKQFYIIVDIKWKDFQQYEAILKKLIDIVKEYYLDEKQQEYALQHFIIQVYNQETFDITKRLYNFDNIIYTLYRQKDKNPIRAAEFCLKNKIPVVTIYWERIYQAETIAIFKEKNIRVYTYTVNDKETIKTLCKFGVDGYYTDFLMPNIK